MRYESLSLKHLFSYSLHKPCYYGSMCIPLLVFNICLITHPFIVLLKYTHTISAWSIIHGKEYRTIESRSRNLLMMAIRACMQLLPERKRQGRQIAFLNLNIFNILYNISLLVANQISADNNFAFIH